MAKFRLNNGFIMFDVAVGLSIALLLLASITPIVQRYIHYYRASKDLRVKIHAADRVLKYSILSGITHQDVTKSTYSDDVSRYNIQIDAKHQFQVLVRQKESQ